MAVHVDVAALADELLPANDFEEFLRCLESPHGPADPGALSLSPDADLASLLAEKAVPADKLSSLYPGKNELQTPGNVGQTARNTGVGGADNGSMEVESYFSDEEGRFASWEEMEQFKEDNDVDGAKSEEAECEVGKSAGAWRELFIPLTESVVAPKNNAEEDEMLSSDSGSCVESIEEWEAAKSEGLEKDPEAQSPGGLSGKEIVTLRKRRYRALKIKKWLKKRRTRKWKKEALYDSRVDAAKRRPRSKGKFLKQEITWVPAPSVFK